MAVMLSPRCVVTLSAAETRTDCLPPYRMNVTNAHLSAHTDLRTVLLRDGIRAAVIHLNRLTTFRFTALYRFDEHTLHNLCFYDRENPTVHSSPDIPVLASYCVFVREQKNTFATANSLHDERVRNHPKQRLVHAYCGVPLVDRMGNMFGTICHFSIEPTPTREADIELMEAMGRLIAELDIFAAKART